MNGKFIFFDIDGTIWDWEEKVPESTAAAIAGLKANGHHPVICSGRAKAALHNKKLEELCFEGVIAACGGHVEYDGRMIYEKYVEEEWVRKLIGLGQECNIPLVLEGPEKQWVSQKGFENDDFVDRMYENIPARIEPLTGYSPDIIINKFSGDILRCSCYDRFREGLQEYYTFIEHGKPGNIAKSKEQEPNAILCVMEAVPHGMSKADGIRRFCEYFSVDPCDVFAVGDSVNDIEMIKFAGTGIVMGNGSEQIKAVADYITTDIHDDGIYNAMKHFGLI